MYRGPAVKCHDKIVRFDRKVTLIALEGVHSRHNEDRVHQRCHNQGTLRDELISHETMTEETRTFGNKTSDRTKRVSREERP